MRKWLWIAVLNAGFTSLLCGQTRTLLLSDCLDLALEHSHHLKFQDEQIRAAQATQSAAQSLYYPHLLGQLSHDQLFFSHYNYRQQFATAALDWSLGDWLKRTALADAKLAEAEKTRRQQTALQVVQRVATLFVGILRDQRELALFEQRSKILQEHEQVAEAQWQAGIRTELDVVQTRVALNDLREQKMQLQAQANGLQTTLVQLLNLQTAETLVLHDFPDQIIEVEPDSAQTQLLRNPLLQSLHLEADSQRLRLRQVAAARLPHVQLWGGFVVDRDPTAEGNYWHTGVQVQLPIFRWGKTKFKRQEIEAQAKALQWQGKQARQELEIEHAQLLQRLAGLRQIYRLKQERVEITRQSLQIATATYHAGLITNLEYLNVQEENMTTRVALNDARLTYVLGLIENDVMTNQLDKIKLLQEPSQ